MNIEILTYLAENPIKYGVNDNYPIEGIPLSEIEELEVKYNEGKQFPKALRELLFMAGEYCYVLDYGPFRTQNRMQEAQRERLQDGGYVISRPFFAIDCYCYGSQFLFIYLDEGDNPPVNVIDLEYGSIWEINNDSLSLYINELIDIVKAGQNPF